MNDATVCYYTSNLEHPTFEERIRAALLTVTGSLPIVSVSQKPIDLGTNICVGEVGACDANAKRQLLIAAQAATTPLVIVAESDCLYPPGYFTWRPEVIDQCYRYAHVWMLWRRTFQHGHPGFKRKEFTEGAEIVGREYLIRGLTAALTGWPEWSIPGERRGPKPEFVKRSWGYYGDESEPMVSIKTGWGLRPFTGTVRDCPPRDELPYWGAAEALRERLFAA